MSQTTTPQPAAARSVPTKPSKSNVGQHPSTSAGKGLDWSSRRVRAVADRRFELRAAPPFHCQIGGGPQARPLRERGARDSRWSLCPDSGHHFGTLRGVSITEHCDENNLTTNERLELLLNVCRAIQHAHLKGIIHRDIKPNNCIVTLLDGRPVPKVIDFGIAKATQKRLTEKTSLTDGGKRKTRRKKITNGGLILLEGARQGAHHF